MKMPSHCPTCGDPMLLEYRGEWRQTLVCQKRLNHYIKLTGHLSDDSLHDEVYAIRVRLNSKVPPTWAEFVINPSANYIYIWSGDSQIVWRSDKQRFQMAGTALPYFEPDLTNYNKLVEKVKIYLLFS